MKLALPIMSESDPLPYHYSDTISISFREFRMWLMQSRLPDTSNQIVKVIFPWTDAARAFNQKDRHNLLPQAAKGMVADINKLLEDSPCVVVFAQISKLFCEVAIATPEAAQLHMLLEDMPCPENFAVPVTEELDINAIQYLAGQNL